MDYEKLTGRTVLTCPEKEITRDNLLDVWKRLKPLFEENKAQSDYLYWYYRGKQPILYREKKVRPEICNKVLENHANEIVSFKKGYSFGSPVQYIRRAMTEAVSKTADAKRQKGLLKLNEMMSMVDKESLDDELAEWMLICGRGFRMILPNTTDPDCPFEMDVLDPRYTDVVYHTGFGRKPIMSVQEVTVYDQQSGKPKPIYCIYTPTRYFVLDGDGIAEEAGNPLGLIPVVEYPANNARIGAFELVIGLLDTINTVASNRLDGLEQFIQAFMKFVNVKISKQQFEDLKELGALMFESEPGNPAEVGMVTAELDQQQTQTLVDHLYQMALVICGMPDRNGANRTTGDTGQAVILRDGWSAAETKAKELEKCFKRSEKVSLRIMLFICGKKLGLKLSDIDIKCPRGSTDNLLTKTQGLQNLLEAGAAPEVAFPLVGLFSDPEQACKDSETYLEKWKPQTQSVGGTVTPGNDAVEADTTPANNKSNPKEE